MNRLLWMLTVLLLAAGAALAQERMIITTRDGKVQSYETSAIQKIEFQSGPAVKGAVEPAPAPPARMAALQSYNYQTHFVRHANFLGEITPIASDLDKKDATFRIAPGLADSRSVSFESVNYPGYYLRHQNYRVQLHKFDGSQLFKDDATFKLKPGLADASWVSLESSNYPGHYLRHRNYHLYLEQGADDLFKKDSTFKFIAPTW